jgi:hypothetical protein
MRPVGAVVKWKRCIIWYEMEQKRAGCFTILVAAVVLGAVLDRCSGKHSSESSPVVSNPAISTPAVPAQTPAEQAAQTEREAASALANPRYAMGQEFSVGYFSYRVNKVEVISDPYRGLLLAVDITVRNDDSSESMTPMLKLLDENGKERGSAIVALATPSGDVLAELRPGVVNRGYAAFDSVPTDGKYILLVSGGLASGRSAIVPLFEQSAVPPPVSDTTPPSPSAPQPLTATSPPVPPAEASQEDRELAAWKRDCSLWQDEAIKTLFKQEKLPAFMTPDKIRRRQEESRCGIFASMVFRPDGSIHSVEQWRPQEEAPALPAPPIKPTSGVLCNWPVEVPQNGEVKFRNLPSDRLKFTFDHDAWLPRIHREPDGTQTLIMRSIKPGVQTMCDIRWEIVQ